MFSLKTAQVLKKQMLVFWHLPCNNSSDAKGILLADVHCVQALSKQFTWIVLPPSFNTHLVLNYFCYAYHVAGAVLDIRNTTVNET